MLQVVILLAVPLVLILVLKGVSVLLSERSVLRREELSPYECGFEHHNVSRIPFSMRYFILTLLFLLFDLEIVFLLLLPSRTLVGRALPAFSALLFLVFLLLGQLSITGCVSSLTALIMLLVYAGAIIILIGYVCAISPNVVIQSGGF